MLLTPCRSDVDAHVLLCARWIDLCSDVGDRDVSASPVEIKTMD